MWMRILYLAYLVDWKKNHKGKAFKNMVPACFNEWKNCEFRDMLNHPEWYTGKITSFCLEHERERRSRKQ